MRNALAAAWLEEHIESASEWVEATGCVLSDLTEDDALVDLIDHLGLRKYEGKRLRKALSEIALDAPVRASVAQTKDSGQVDAHDTEISVGQPADARPLDLEDCLQEPEPERSYPSPRFPSPRALQRQEKHVSGDADHSALVLSKAVTKTDACCLSPVKAVQETDLLENASASRLLEQLEQLRHSSTDAQALASIHSAFHNADDVFAAFETFGPGAVAMFEFDDVASKFRLTLEAESVFRELGISHESTGEQGVQQFLDALESNQELQQFLETLIGHATRRDSLRETSEEASHLNLDTCTDTASEACTLPYESTLCESPTLSSIADDMQKTDGTQFPELAKLEPSSKGEQESLLCQREYTPTTNVEVRVVLANGSTQPVLLQKRVVDKSWPTHRAALALELRKQCGDESVLRVQLDVSRILDIQEMEPSSADRSMSELSFFLTINSDALLYLREGEQLHEIFHGIAPDADAEDYDRFSLHVLVGPCETSQAQATRFFNGLRLLAKLPSDRLQLAAKENNALNLSLLKGNQDKEDAEMSDEEGVSTIAESQPPDSDSDEGCRTISIDLSYALEESFTGSGCGHQGKTSAAEDAPDTGRVLFNASHVRWNVVLEAARSRGWQIITSEEKAARCNVHWLDDSSIKDGLSLIQPWMRVNHFPGTCRSLGRKCRLARTMSRMQVLFPDEYSFVPRSWLLPEDFPELAARVTKEIDVKTTYIVKPDGLSQGRGIFLTDDLERIRKVADDSRRTGEGFVVQKYLAKPMLLDGLKFDMRIYCLVVGGPAGVGPDMRLFLFQEGLVRLCTDEYQVPTPDTFDQFNMHLTNYEVNRHSKAFKKPTQVDSASGSKRALTWLLEYIGTQFGEEERRRVWADITELCVKTVLAAQPTLDAEYNACFTKDLTCGGMGCRSFEILGFDVMLDRHRKAYLIEVNHLPSLGCDSPLDRDVKRRLIDQTLDLTCGSVDAHVTNKSTYEGLLSADPPATPSGSALLDLAEYKDFKRIFPPTKDCSQELAELTNRISTKVRGVFGSVMAARPSRAASPVPIQGGFASERRATSSALFSTPRLGRCRSVERRNTNPAATAAASDGSASTPRAAARTPRRSASAAATQRISRCSSAPGLAASESSAVAGTRRSATSLASGLTGVGTRKEERRGSAWSLARERGLDSHGASHHPPARRRASSAAKLVASRPSVSAKLSSK